MSGQIRKQGDPLLRAVLDSARLDEPPAGAEDALLAALGLGAAMGAGALGTKLGVSQAPLATGASALAKAAPLAAKLLGVLGVVGLGAVAWTQPTPALRAPRDSERPMAKRTIAPLPMTEPVAPAPLPALPRAEPVAPRTVAPAPRAEAAAAEEAPPSDSLAVEIRLLAAARGALASGDKSAARVFLREYEREVNGGALQREADVLWERAR